MRIDGETFGDVHQQIADVARTMHGTDFGDPADVTQRVVDYAVEAIPGAQYAGITVVRANKRVESPAVSHPYPALLDAVQEGQQQGPCLSAAWHQNVVRIDDLSTETRWPRYSRDALKITPIRSVLSFRMFTAEATMGALNVFAEKPGAFDHGAEDIGVVLATHMALAWDSVRREKQFQSALASRDIIGQAKGILMNRFGIDAVQAFELLKRLSQDTNRKLVDLAHEVAATGTADALER